MKKIFAFLLSAALLVGMLVVPAAAAGHTNTEADVSYVKTAPKIDGVVNSMEYGSIRPLHKYSEVKDQFGPDDHDDFEDWDINFYICWDDDNLYMAWVVETSVHSTLLDSITNLGEMWQYCMVQFVITPGAPKEGETTYQNSDFLNVGFCLRESGDIARTAWDYPKGVNSNDISINDWNAAIVRNDAANTTTYEIAIPWEMSGIDAKGDNAQFGLAYAVGAQDFYGAKRGMLEWQDVVLTGSSTKYADKCAVMSLVGSGQDQVIVNPGPVEGEIPSDAEGKVQIPIDDIDKGFTAGSACVYTDAADIGNRNVKYAYNMLLDPVEGKDDHYTIVEYIQGAGETIAFASEIKDDMIVVSLHTNGSGEPGYDRWLAARELGVGSEVVLFGVDIENGKMAYSNAMLYVVDGVEIDDGNGETSDDTSDDTSADTSDDTSADDTSADTSADDTSADTSADASNATSNTSADTSDAADEDEGSNIGLIIGIVAAVVVIAAVVVVVLKKKK